MARRVAVFTHDDVEYGGFTDQDKVDAISEVGYAEQRESESSEAESYDPWAYGSDEYWDDHAAVEYCSNDYQKRMEPAKWGMTVQQLYDLYIEVSGEVAGTRPGGLGDGGMSMNDIVEKYVKPKTLGHKAGYAVTINKGAERTAGTFISHSWSETFDHLVSAICMKCFSEDTTIEYCMHQYGYSSWDEVLEPESTVWICCFALNQNADIREQVGEEPAESPFAYAIDGVQRFIVVMNVNVKLYTRGWCMFELYRGLQKFGLDSINIVGLPPREMVAEFWCYVKLHYDENAIDWGAFVDGFVSGYYTHVEDIEAEAGDDKMKILQEIEETHGVVHIEDSIRYLHGMIMSHYCKFLAGRMVPDETDDEAPDYYTGQGIQFMTMRKGWDEGPYQVEDEEY